MSTKPFILFICVKNGGKSQMAAAMMHKTSGHMVEVDSAGTTPGVKVNALSTQVLLDIGVDITHKHPKQLTDAMISGADRVIVLGREAVVQSVNGTPIEVWDIDEPSERGIEGIERMRLVRDDIQRRVQALERALTQT